MNKKILYIVFSLIVIAISGVTSVFAQSDDEDLFQDPEATDEHCGYTDESTAGPYYIAGAPETDNLNLQNIEGTAIVVSGVVYDGSTGEPIPNASVEVWHTDQNGAYYPETSGDAADFDTADINLRGTVLANEDGEYTFTTIEPGIYEGRRRHIHYYITADGYLPLFTQTYWIDDPNTEVDQTDADTEACRILTFEEDEDGVIAATFDIYLREDTTTVIEAPPFTLLNLNTATDDDFLTIPDVGNRMVREFMEYRPYISILQFRREIGKYVDEEQVAAYEAYVYVPVQVNDSDAETLKQLPGVDDTVAEALIAARPYDSNEAFLEILAAYVSAADAQMAANYLETE